MALIRSRVVGGSVRHREAVARRVGLDRMADPAFRERLGNAPDAAEIYRLIKEEDARH